MTLDDTIIREVPVPEAFPGHRSPGAPPDKDFNTEVKSRIAIAQLSDALRDLPVACARCKEEHRSVDLFRCFFCLVWYCHRCSAVHFGHPPGKHMLGLKK